MKALGKGKPYLAVGFSLIVNQIFREQKKKQNIQDKVILFM